ncbi:MAG: hypothetical protein MI742_10490 [Desulfobacterales bacterium]|nr:hypothetical protein [Desulfobacterales bacterium]
MKTWKPYALNGHGSIRQFTIRQGMTLTLQNLTYSHTHNSQIEVNAPPLTFYYCYSGAECIQAKGGNQSILFTQGASGIFSRSPENDFTSKISGKTPVCVLTIQITPECFDAMALASTRFFQHVFIKPKMPKAFITYLCIPPGAFNLWVNSCSTRPIQALQATFMLKANALNFLLI